MGEAQPGQRPDRRLHALDGLRGAAAVVVVVHHALLTMPEFAAPYYGADGAIDVPVAAWIMTYTPLHLVWAGSEAVYLFFILSGIVLTLPVLRRAGFDWFAYYPRRLIRLYGPVLVAVLLGVVLIALAPRRDDVALGEWMTARPGGYPPVSIVKDMVLVTGVSDVISPLWSLRWEVLFSLLLPLYVLFGRRARGAVGVKVALVAVLIIVASVLRIDSLLYLLIFAVGVLAAVHWDAVTSAARRVDGIRGAWPTVVAAAILLTCARWEAVGLGVDPRAASSVSWLAVPGVALVVFAGAFWSPLRTALETRAVQWLGTVSFSLYLVHEPFIIAFRLLLPVDRPWLAAALAIAVSFAVAALFTRYVERPTHRFARAVGGRLERRRSGGMPAEAAGDRL
jgi:peptidoglycan/LPS O-acetylase OafA/YrhL